VGGLDGGQDAEGVKTDLIGGVDDLGVFDAEAVRCLAGAEVGVGGGGGRRGGTKGRESGGDRGDGVSVS